MRNYLKVVLTMLLVIVIHSLVVIFGFFSLGLNYMFLVWGVTLVFGFVLWLNPKIDRLGSGIIGGCVISFFTSIFILIYIASGFS